MDPRRSTPQPFYPNNPATPSTQAPNFPFPATPLDPNTFGFGGFSQPQNPWQMQMHHQQHFHMQMPPPNQMPTVPARPETQAEHDFISLGVDDDVIPETQPTSKKDTKGKKRATTKADSVPWTQDELEALARAWVNVSTDPIRSTNRNKDGFWNAVCEQFFILMQRTPYRTFHAVSTKFREMNAKCGEFAGVYQRCWNNRKTGESDENVLKNALGMFCKKKASGGWAYMRPYEILRACDKWRVVPNEVAQAKRTKTSTSGSYSAGGSDARCTININDDPEFEDDAPAPDLERPIGRDRAKKAASGSKGKATASKLSVVDRIDSLISNFNEFKSEQNERWNARKKEKEEALDLEREKLALEKARLAYEQEKVEFAMMDKNIDDLPEQERAGWAAKRNMIANKWLGKDML